MVNLITKIPQSVAKFTFISARKKQIVAQNAKPAQSQIMKANITNIDCVIFSLKLTTENDVLLPRFNLLVFIFVWKEKNMIEYDGGCRANKRGKIRQIGVTVTPQHRQITRNQSVPTYLHGYTCQPF